MSYQKGTIGHILDAIKRVGVPENITNILTLSDGLVYLHSRQFAEYKYFNDIKDPLFLFTNNVYNGQKFLVNEDSIIVPAFRLTLSDDGLPCFEIKGRNATEGLHSFLHELVSVDALDEEAIKVTSLSDAFFSVGYDQPLGNHFKIIIGNPAFANEFIEYINRNYTPMQFGKPIKNLERSDSLLEV